MNHGLQFPYIIADTASDDAPQLYKQRAMEA